MRKCFKDKGFSVVELLVVIAIMATLIAIGTPAIVGKLNHQRLNRSARDMMTELNAARMRAIAKNYKHRVGFTLNAAPAVDTFRLAYWDTGTSAWINDPQRTTMQVNDNVDIVSPGSNFNVEFFANGTATATDICLQNTSDNSDKIELTVEAPTGKVTLQTGC